MTSAIRKSATPEPTQSREYAELAHGMAQTYGYKPCDAPLTRPLFFAKTRDEHERDGDLCMDCPLAVRCAAYATAAGEQHGVWGGLTEWDRDLSRKAAVRGRSPKAAAARAADLAARSARLAAREGRRDRAA